MKEEMMDCKTIREQLPDYLLGELDPKKELRVSEHLIDCASCKREVQELEKLLGAMKDERSSQPQRDVYERIRLTTGMRRTVPLLSILHKPIRCYHAVAALVLGIILASLSNTLLEKRAHLSGKIKPAHETIYESPASEDSITFYTAPSRQLHYPLDFGCHL
jgi:anti-sigma factor RsiW